MEILGATRVNLQRNSEGGLINGHKPAPGNILCSNANIRCILLA